MDSHTYDSLLAEQAERLAIKAKARAQADAAAERGRRLIAEQAARTCPSWILPPGTARQAAEAREAAEARQRMADHRRVRTHAGASRSHILSNFMLRGRRAQRPRAVVAATRAEPPPDDGPEPPPSGPTFDALRALGWTWRTIDRHPFGRYAEPLAWVMLAQTVERARP